MSLGLKAGIGHKGDYIPEGVETIAIINQGGGCDYTVHCGTKVVCKAPNETMEDFVTEVMEDYDEYDEIDFFNIQRLTPVKKEVVTKWGVE